MALTIRSICDAIEAELGQIVGIVRAQGPDDLREGVPDLPLLQVIPESGESGGGESTERITFTGGVDTIAPIRKHNIVISVDVLVCVLSMIWENMDRFLTLLDATYDRMELQRSKYFGLTGIHAMNWGWARMQRELSQEKYVGFRVTIRLIVYTQG